MSPRIPHITGVQIVRALRRVGWYPDYQRGSHVYLKHQEHPNMRVNDQAQNTPIDFEASRIKYRGVSRVAVARSNLHEKIHDYS